MKSSLAQQAFDYAATLARRNLNPLSALTGTRRPRPWQQFPDPDGIHWISPSLGYYYHSHGSRAQPRGEHGHFHLFARACPGAGRDHALPADYAHLVAIAVDDHGAPRRVFTTNLWVTAGLWLSGREIARQLDRFARRASRRQGGPERWVGLLLRLHRDEIHQVLRARTRRTAHWRAARLLGRRLADRRIATLSAAGLSLEACAA